MHAHRPPQVADDGGSGTAGGLDGGGGGVSGGNDDEGVYSFAVLPAVSERRLEEREREATEKARLALASLGQGVSTEAQMVFDALCKTCVLSCAFDLGSSG